MATISKYDANTGKFLGRVSVRAGQSYQINHPGYSPQEVYAQEGDNPVYMVRRFAVSW